MTEAARRERKRESSDIITLSVGCRQRRASENFVSFWFYAGRLSFRLESVSVVSLLPSLCTSGSATWPFPRAADWCLYENLTGVIDRLRSVSVGLRVTVSVHECGWAGGWACIHTCMTKNVPPNLRISMQNVCLLLLQNLNMKKSQAIKSVTYFQPIQTPHSTRMYISSIIQIVRYINICSI